MRKKNKVKELLGANIRKYRELNNLSQEVLAEKIGCNSKYLSDLETGRSFASSELIEKLTSIFDIPVSFLFQEASEKVALEKSLDKIIDDEAIKLAVVMKKRIREL